MNKNKKLKCGLKEHTFLKNDDCLKFCKHIKADSISMILTDPPYQVSRKTNFCSGNEKGNYTDRFRINMEFGHWDSAEHNDVINYQSLLTQFYRILKKGGVCIMFWDLWKIQDLANMFKKAGFKQLRFIEWIKTNPVPINSRCNYLTNAREVAVLGVKVGKSTFNAKYHNGVYKFPIEHSKDRWHPTQKSLKLFEELIKTHTKEGEIVLDPFLGSGTTAVAAIKLNRIAYGSELEKSYFEKILKRIKGI